MRIFALVCALLVGRIAVAAEPPALVLVISEKGYAWMVQDANGDIAVYKFSQIVTLGKPPVVVPPTGFGLEQQIRSMVAGLSESGKADLAAVGKGIADTAKMATDGKLKTLGEVEAVAAALMGAAIRDRAAWGPVAASIDDALVKLQTSGKIATPADYGRALAEIARGMGVQ